jgi:cell division protein FtsL
MATLDRLAPPQTTTPAASAWSPRRAIIVVCLMAAIIALLQVVQSSSFARTGSQLQQLQQQRADLRAQIHQLEADVAALSSLDRIERNAVDRLGMMPAVRTDYISVPVEAPEGPLLPRPFMARTPPEPDSGAAWWEKVLRAIPRP